MSTLPKVIRKPSILIGLVTGLVLLVIVMIVVLAVQRRPSDSEAGFKAKAAFNHTEDFSSDSFKDPATTATWNTDKGVLRITTNYDEEPLLDPTFTPNPNLTVRALALDDETLFVAGDFGTIGGQSRNLLAAVNTTTGLATSFDPNPNGGFGNGSSLVFSNGILYASGTFTSIGGQTRNFLAALDPATGLATSFDPNPSSTPQGMLAAGDTLYVGGPFSNIAGEVRNGLASFNTTNGQLNPFDANASDTTLLEIRDFILDGDTLYFGGVFDMVGGQARSQIASVNAQTGAVTSFNPTGVNGRVNIVEQDENNIYIGGLFTTVNGETRNRLAAFDKASGTLTAFDPNVSAGIGGPIRSSVLDGPNLIVGGNFVTIGGQSRTRLAIIDTATALPRSFNPAPNGTIETMLLDDTDLYVGGSFTSIAGSGETITRLARFLMQLESAGLGQSLNVNTTTDNVLSATLTADLELNDGTATFYLSNDGGVTWEPVTLNVPHTFTSVGSDLRWRVELSRDLDSTTLTPIIDSLSIDFITAEPVIPEEPEEPTPDEPAIIRVEGEDPIQLAINTSQERFPATGSAENVVLARSDIMSDAFAMTPYANLKNASLLLTPSDSIPGTVMNEITRLLGPGGSNKTVYLAGGFVALTEQIESDLRAAGFTTQFRFPGEHRRETARLIANQIMQENPVPVNHAFVSEDQAFIDTLGLGSIAGQKITGSVRPILLTQRGVATPDASLLTFLAEHPLITSLEIAGGPVAVPYEVGPSIQQQRPQIVTLARSEGADRFETNQTLNNKHYPAPTTVVVANGESSSIPGSLSVSATAASGGLFSALLAGNFAAGQSAPLVITTRDVLPEPTERYLTEHVGTIDTVYLIGSFSLISQAVEDAIAAIIR